MSEYLPESQKVCQNRCQVECQSICQNECQIEFQNICHIYFQMVRNYVRMFVRVGFTQRQYFVIDALSNQTGRF